MDFAALHAPSSDCCKHPARTSLTPAADMFRGSAPKPTVQGRFCQSGSITPECRNNFSVHVF